MTCQSWQLLSRSPVRQIRRGLDPGLWDLQWIWGTRPGKPTKSQLEHGPVEIVELPILEAETGIDKFWCAVLSRASLKWDLEQWNGQNLKGTCDWSSPHIHNYPLKMVIFHSYVNVYQRVFDSNLFFASAPCSKQRDLADMKEGLDSSIFKQCHVP